MYKTIYLIVYIVVVKVLIFQMIQIIILKI